MVNVRSGSMETLLKSDPFRLNSKYFNMNWLDIVWSILSKLYYFYVWIKYRKYIRIVQGLDDFEKHILSGLLNSPTPLEFYQAYNKSTGRNITLNEIFLSRKEEFAKKLIKKNIILSKDNGYILTKEAEFVIRQGALGIKR